MGASSEWLNSGTRAPGAPAVFTEAEQICQRVLGANPAEADALAICSA